MLKKKKSKYNTLLSLKNPLDYCKINFKDGIILNLSPIIKAEKYNINIIKVLKIWLHNGDVVMTFITDLNGRKERFNAIIYDKKTKVYAKIVEDV